MRIDLWQRVLEDLEDCRAATLVTSTDFAKAFNRLFFQQCLDSFASHGASSEVVRLLATFLTNRKMSVRVQNDWSVPRPVHGGYPKDLSSTDWRLTSSRGRTSPGMKSGLEKTSGHWRILQKSRIWSHGMYSSTEMTTTRIGEFITPRQNKDG